MANKSCESVLFFFLFLVISFNAISVSAQKCDNTTGTFIPDSPYDKNRQLIHSTLASNVTAQAGYYFIGSIGIAADQVYTMGMCAPAAENDVCSLCIKTTSESLLQSCPNEADAFFWSGEETLCLVRYSNRPFSGLLDMEPRGAIYNTGELNTNLTEFDLLWKNLTSGMIAGITSSSSGANNSSKYYAYDFAPVPDFKNISAMMQCTPDVSSENCSTCLRTNVNDYDNCCRGYQGGVISRPNCFFRWEVYSFSGAIDQINLPKSPPPSPTTSPVANITKKDRRISGGTIAGIVAVIVVTIILIVVGLVIFRRRKQKQDIDLPMESVQFDLKTIESATSNFSERNKLGKGGFGEVYKGMLMNGTEIVVKRLSKTSGQGEVEFKNEVVVVAKLQHINLVRLLGFSLQGEEKLLVYEFVSNKSLDYFLFDAMKRNQLDWTMRRNIIGGITRGILYLHQDSRLKIIHRDLKASNILLDADMNPKISDFGMARIFGMDQTVANTGRVVGTFGYMSPEYVTHGQFSMKSDVYSFGVLILEIISGKKNSSFYQMNGLVNNLVTYVWRLWENKSLHELIDPGIKEDHKSHEVIRYIHTGLLCVQENPADRPTMATIHQMLTTSSITLPVPLPPGFFFRNEPGLNPLGQRLEPGQSTSKSFACSVDEATITDVNPR
ncbi:PREDICTED: cysteine-rich receptor-like protein kinase 18 [Camelina sativa]|uniref:Cysteine-rich receptor-like protein kinase 18 n=1 Tax=Camelina sativa TaxID=90675 RepID=A0ABM0U066_CAMSA|nr:PREDICTED: cysteine-rich receptor-like protein kinase 18 [Camelina sativa]